MNSKISSGGVLALVTELVFGRIFGLERDCSEISLRISMLLHDTRISQFLKHSKIM